MRRRDVIAALGLAPLAGQARAWAPSPRVEHRVRQIAADMALAPFERPIDPLGPPFGDLGYEAFQQIRFRTDKALWRDLDLPFQIQFFHRGGGAEDRVAMIEVVGEVERPIPFSPDLFDYGPYAAAAPSENIGFAGFRVHAQINTPAYFDEFAVFLGASYFRAVARGQAYGLSARMLSVNTGESSPEEFPTFRSFWLERPALDATSLVVHALTDSPSLTGAHRIVITPGGTTTMEIETQIFARSTITTLGLAPMSSMYGWGDDGGAEVDDFRPEVHDSDGLAVLTGRGQALLRPLSRPGRRRVSLFADQDPAAFGLVQRDRAFASYQDLAVRYEKRPDLWVTPSQGWGPGEVRLLELPSKGEWEDNIAAFWRPAEPVAAKSTLTFSYRLDWGVAPTPHALAKVVSTRIGEDAFGDGGRLYVIDFAPLDLANLEPQVRASAGTLSGVSLQANPETGGIRLAFRLKPSGAGPIELQACLNRQSAPVTELWVNQWTK